MYKLLHLFLNICSIVSIIYIFIFLKEIIKYIYFKLLKKECKFTVVKFNNKIKNIILIFIIIIGSINFVLDTWYRQPTIGSFYEKSDYKTKYYIYLYEDDNYINCKKLPAEIECTTNIEEENLDYSTSYYYYRTYYINKIYLPSTNPKFPNDYTINNCINFENIKLDINKRNAIIDTNGNTHYVELTKEKYLANITNEKSLEKIDKKMKQSNPYYENSGANK